MVGGWVGGVLGSDGWGDPAPFAYVGPPCCPATRSISPTFPANGTSNQQELPRSASYLLLNGP